MSVPLLLPIAQLRAPISLSIKTNRVACANVSAARYKLVTILDPHLTLIAKSKVVDAIRESLG
jgi:hypothetical protein